MATHENSYTVSQGSGTDSRDFAYTFPSFLESEVKVEIDNVVKTLTTHYTIVNHNTTSGGTVRFNATGLPNGTTGSLPVRIFRQTDVDSAKATFTAGSALKAADINNSVKQILYALQENIGVNAADRKIQHWNIEDNAIITSKIKDDSVTLAKLANGALPTDITIASANIVDGTIVNDDVNASAAIAGTKVTPAFGSQNLSTSGTAATGALTVTGNIGVSGTVDGRDVAADGTKLDGIESAATADQTAAEIRTLVESASDSNVFTDADHSKLNAIEPSATADQTAAEIRTLVESATNSNVFTDADHTKLNNIETAATADQTASEIKTLLQSDKLTSSEIATGTLDGRYYTETELDPSASAGQNVLDARYYTETEAEAKFLRQDSSETIASGVTWSNSDAYVATTAAINARIVDLIDDVGGFIAIANQTSFPTTNPQGTAGQAAILSISATTATLTPSGTTVTITDGAGSGNDVTITGVSSAIPNGFGFLVESTGTTHTYTFHRLVPKATEVTTVATNITNIAAAGANVADINNFADIYQIAGSAPTQRADGTSLQDGDLWFDNSNDNLTVWNGSSFATITPSQSVLDDVAIVSGAITYSEDLGLITASATTGSSNGSLEIVADMIEDEVTFTVTASGGAYLIDGVSKPALTLYKGWTYTFDLSSNTLGSHPLRFSSGGSLYSTNVTVTGTQGQAGAKIAIKIPESQPTSFIYYCTNHSNMGNTITVKDDPIKTVSDDIVKIKAVADNKTNIDAVQANATNINAVAGNNSNITSVAGNASNINSAVSNASNINTVAGSITNVNTVGSNISNVNNFADRYQIASSAPSTDGGGNALAAGDLYFDTTANELKVHTGSAWQGGVTATGNFAAVTGSTYTGTNIHNDNVKSVYGTSSDGMEIFHNASDSIINDTGTGSLKLQTGGSTKLEILSTGATVTGLITATTIDGAAGDNLQLDFGTLS